MQPPSHSLLPFFTPLSSFFFNASSILHSEMLFKAFTALCVATVALAQNSFSINTPDAFIQCRELNVGRL